MRKLSTRANINRLNDLHTDLDNSRIRYSTFPASASGSIIVPCPQPSCDRLNMAIAVVIRCSRNDWQRGTHQLRSPPPLATTYMGGDLAMRSATTWFILANMTLEQQSSTRCSHFKWQPGSDNVRFSSQPFGAKMREGGHPANRTNPPTSYTVVNDIAPLHPLTCALFGNRARAPVTPEAARSDSTGWTPTLHQPGRRNDLAQTREALRRLWLPVDHSFSVAPLWGLSGSPLLAFLPVHPLCRAALYYYDLAICRACLKTAPEHLPRQPVRHVGAYTQPHHLGAVRTVVTERMRHLMATWFPSMMGGDTTDQRTSHSVTFDMFVTKRPYRCSQHHLRTDQPADDRQRCAPLKRKIKQRSNVTRSLKAGKRASTPDKGEPL
ncbi:hypothetical protein PSHI_48000 [Pseudomonas sp. URMO17WK12:I11]|nr:hypothetical protein PSHI_48000 [Pseudomonas sp. URMO17WK12:I11]